MSSSTTSIDYAGLDQYGFQDNPTSGNPIHLYIFDSSITAEENPYVLRDLPDYNQDGIMKTGYVMFVEEVNGVKLDRRVGFINYDLGIIVFDSEYIPGGYDLISSIGSSGMTFDKALMNNNFFIKNINFSSINFVERLIVNLAATGFEMNISENPTAIDKTTNTQKLNPSAGYITSIGLYNDLNDLIAVAKLSKPLRKDAEHNTQIQVKFDF